YPMDWSGWGPRLAVDYAVTRRITFHAGAAVTTILPNLWQGNFGTGAVSFVFFPLVTGEPNVPVAFQNTIGRGSCAAVYATGGQLLFASGDSSKVPANTPIDLQRFQKDLEALTPGNEAQLFSTAVIARNFRNGYIGTYTAGIDQDLRVVKLDVAYVGTAGIHLASVFSPNGYAGADPAYAPFTQ